jgi:hypothetical protein
MPIDDHGKFVPEKRTHSNAAAQKYVPIGPAEKDAVRERKERFEALNDYIRKAGGWITSVPGNRLIDFEVLPGSPLPDDLRARGYTVHADGEGERILHSSVVEWFTRTSSGAFELMTEGSTKPPASRVTHAGIARVERFFFDMETKTAR